MLPDLTTRLGKQETPLSDYISIVEEAKVKLIQIKIVLLK